MTLGELVAGIGSVEGVDAGVEIAGLAYDSREVRSGTLFCCVPGYRSDGHDYAARAVADGAVALVVERPLGLGVPEVVVPSVRAAMGPIAARFHGDPTGALRVVGITGTNGKTTTAFLVRALLQAAGEQTGLLGTVTSIVGGEQWPTQRTTPEAIDLQAQLRAMLDNGDRACAMEVSSHALALGRTDGVEFAAAVFTNLTQDHLDYHPTMEDYYLAKRLLFLPDGRDGDGEGSGARPGVSVVNVGDPYGRRLAQEIEGAIVTFAVDDPDARGERGAGGIDGDRGEADYRATDLRCDVEGCRFTLHTPAGDSEVMLPMPGRFNVANALGALAAVHALSEAGRHRPAAGIPVSANDLDTLVGRLERGVRVPGRFEPVHAGQEFAVLVDYAHTPDSLENVLRAARDVARGRVICVFGAGGDRDRGKRPLMGEIASRLADVTVVTSDNPRSEAPEAIVAEIVAGIPPGHAGRGARDADGRRGRAAEPAVDVEVDRRTAIARAISLAAPDDVVVIAGKGHEQGQELADGVKLPFDDVTVARALLSARVLATGAQR
jgi:UDP-N-acetylmuramoyl-L-alanyl-D-glutamate--2,6-diaminopimelate ligase